MATLCKSSGKELENNAIINIIDIVTKYNTCGRRGRLRLRQRLDWIDTLC